MDISRNLSLAIVVLVLGIVSAGVSSHGAELVWDAETGWSVGTEDQRSEADSLYKHGRALFVKGETLAALDVFEAIEQKYPASPSAARAKLARAKCLEHMGQFEQAIRVCEEVMAMATHEMPASEIILLQIGVLEKMSLVDPVRATELLTQFAESAPTEEIRNAAQDALARIPGESQASDPDGMQAFSREVMPDERLALFNSARENLQSCREGVHDEERLVVAREQFQKFLESGSQAKREPARAYVQAIDSILIAADSEHRSVYYAMTYMPEERYAEARRVFKRAAKRFQETAMGEMAEFQLAECLYLEGRFWKAFHSYEDLLESYSQTDSLPAVCGREFAIAEALLEQEKPKKAIDVLKALINNDPVGPLVDDAQMYIGRAYMKRGKYLAAKESFVSIPRDFPRSEWSKAAIFLGGKADFLSAELASDSEELLAKARDAFELYLWDAPKGAFSNEAKTLLQATLERQASDLWDIARFYEKSRKYQSAVWYYGLVSREYPDSPHARQAAAAIETYSSLGFRTP